MKRNTAPTASPSVFPDFADGDVLVVLDSAHTYRLHANVLRSCSPVFTALLSDQAAATLSRRALQEGVRLRWRLDLHGQSEFRVIPLDNMGTSRRMLPLGEIGNAQGTNMAYRGIDNLLRAFYNERLQIGGDSFMTSLQDCNAFVGIAEDYEALKTVAQRVETELIRHGKALYRSVANNPPAWLGFACRSRSVLIFREALVHVVGRWQLLSADERATLDPAARAIVEAKHHDFQLRRQAIELRIAGHYPTSLHKTMESGDIPGRAAYANEVFHWMALSLFRHWFAQNVCDGHNYHASDGGFRFYSLLRAGGRAYLDRPDVESFFQYFPVTARARIVLDNYLGIIKADVAKLVAPLFVNNTSLDLAEGEAFAHLVSLDVGMHDHPWSELKDTNASGKHDEHDMSDEEDEEDHDMDDEPEVRLSSPAEHSDDDMDQE